MREWERERKERKGRTVGIGEGEREEEERTGSRYEGGRESLNEGVKEKGKRDSYSWEVLVGC